MLKYASLSHNLWGSVEHVINDGLIVQQLVRKTIQDQKAQQDLQDEKHAVSKDNSESFLKEWFYVAMYVADR